METKRAVVAANVRARLGWSGLSGVEAGRRLGISHGSISNKLRGATPFTGDELAKLAELFGLGDPGPFYRMPEGFGAPPTCDSIRSFPIAGRAGHPSSWLRKRPAPCPSTPP